MKFINISPVLSLGFAVMLLLSVAVHPVMAADATKKQLESFSVNDIKALAIDELVSDPSGSLSMMSASSDEDFQEFQQGKFHVRAKDPLADQHSTDIGEFSASSAGNGDPVDAQIAGAIANLSQEGYDPSGQTEHHYQETLDSEKFRNIDSTQRALLETKGLHIDAMDPTALTLQEDATYYFFTNPATNATRVMTVVQLVDKEGNPAGERKMTVSEDIVYSKGDDATENGFSASVFGEELALVPLGAALITEATPLLTGGAVAAGAASTIPVVGIVIVVVIVVVVLVLVFLCIFWFCKSEPTPTPTPTPPLPDSSIVLFGNTTAIVKSPSGTDYSRLGGASAIRRNGTMDSFIPAPYLPGTDWVMVTNGAAIKTDGTLVTWNPGSTTPVWNPCGVKKYVAVSQWRDWLLTIYEDGNGQTHLEPIANPASPPEIFKSTPSDTGWKMVAAGNNHALALRSDGTLVTWGRNTDHQLELPAATKYHDIEAGDDFSVALDTEGSIYTAGKDDAGQVSGKPSGTGYMSIEVGPANGAALTKNGTVVQWGRVMPGTQPPVKAGNTDLSLGLDYGFALQENVKEAAVTAPLSPGRTIRALDGTDVKIPFGSSFDHTHNDVTRVFAPDGTQILWANDENATQVHFPSSAVVPISVLHYVPSGSRVDGTVDYTATVKNSGGVGGNIMTVTEDAWYDEQNPSVKATLPRAMCFAGKGCSAAITTKKQTFLSDPLPASISSGSTGTFTPVFSVHKLSNKSWVGTISTLTTDGSVGSAESVSLVMDKNDVDPNQAINFSIVSENWGNIPGQSLFVTAKTNITGGDSALHYTITGTSSVAVPSVSVIPRIYRQSPAGDVLVFTGAAQTCPSGKICTVHGDFVPVWDISNITSMFFANTTVVFTLPSAGVGAGGLTSVGLQPPETGDAPTVPEVVVTGPLSPLEPGKLMDAANANNTVPWGGTVEHVMNENIPTTIVYDSSGQPKYRADDRKSPMLILPTGILKPASYTTQVPWGSIIDHRQLQNGVVIITDSTQTNTTLTLTGINNSASNHLDGIGSAADYAWVEYALQRVTFTGDNRLDSYYSEWHVPSKPTRYQTYQNDNMHNGTYAFVFNGISSGSSTTITNLLQPCSIYNYPSAGTKGDNKWVGTVIDATTGTFADYIDLSENQKVSGKIYYNTSSSPYSFWGTITAYSTSANSNTNDYSLGIIADQQELNQIYGGVDPKDVLLDTALEVYLNPISRPDPEAGKSTITDPAYFPGNNIKFENFNIKDSQGNTITPSFAGAVSNWWKSQSGFNLQVNFGSNPYTITLKR